MRMRDRIGRHAQKNALDDEKQQADAADRDRQIRDTHRKEREIRDGIVPGHLDQQGTPDDHEHRDQRHQQLNQQIEQTSISGRQLIGEEAKKENISLKSESWRAYYKFHMHKNVSK